ncbi:TlpA disulfide reductase family protein [Roseomonas sp. KE2513]|uniref:TlpA family protein disulfide reductase n=1 Tax=Roseomonas sp. KE2513 TaxID=2479202 RepID=UPI0028169683|nr:TlpA disulfide reductase family protein [Roseomonas sp. KE2513]
MSGRRGSTSARRFAFGAAVAGIAGVALILALAQVPTGPQSSRQPAAAASATPADRLALVPLAPPRPVPELRFVRGDGRTLALEDFRGRAVLLNIWATWCVPCRTEMPALDRLQAALGGSGFEVVALSIDRGGLPAVEAFYREVGPRSLGVYVDQTGDASRALGTAGIPTTLLIDREGREVARKIGPAEWDGPEMVGAIRRHLDLPEGTGVAPGVASTPRR